MLRLQSRVLVVVALLVGVSGCSVGKDDAKPVVEPSPMAPPEAVVPVAELGESASEDPRPGPFVRGTRGGPLMRLGKDHSGEFVVTGDQVSLHVIHRSQKPLPAKGEVALRIKPSAGDELNLVMRPNAEGTRWVTTIPQDPGPAEAIVTMEIEGVSVQAAVVWAAADLSAAPQAH